MFILLVGIALSQLGRAGLVDASNFQLSCPSGLTDYGEGVCGVILNEQKYYCEAHRACRDEGYKRGLRLVLAGTNVTRFLKMPNFPAAVHTSINKMLGHSDRSKAGWTIGLPGHSDYRTTLQTSLPWYIGKPEKANGLCAFVFHNNLMDVTQNYTTGSSCCEWAGPRSSLLNEHRSERFDALFPEKLTNFFFPDDKNFGCFDQQPMPTLIACAKA
ncbi:hypothetical protein FBUS_09538 [Fasciolopsis buskii]|uniref:Uncharacterized protein n=1 Tax=Fasciolopsis buskii TaxID=27845 RepID=A0A8E0RU50_9TREM|nr:hypothetical protein FBUS_09538 [Fasciolopsis buski]